MLRTRALQQRANLQRAEVRICWALINAGFTAKVIPEHALVDPGEIRVAPIFNRAARSPRHDVVGPIAKGACLDLLKRFSYPKIVGDPVTIISGVHAPGAGNLPKIVEAARRFCINPRSGEGWCQDRDQEGADPNDN